ncbi:MAG: hypothetical protein GY852_07330 [bacterium]|nr:hypothetical protein [bacterium]
MSKKDSRARLLYAGLFITLIFAFAMAGCVDESQSEYVVSEDGGQVIYGDFNPDQSNTLIGAIVDEWRIFSILFVMITVVIIAMMYPLSSALKMPSLKAWADVELGEAISSVLIVVFIIAVLVFVELVTQGIVMGLPDLNCQVADRFCPVTIANQYVQEYLDKSLAIYDDIFESAIKKGKLATMSFVLGTNYLVLLYLSLSLKLFPHFMIEVTTAGQEMQFLMGMRDALVFQQFILNHVSGTLAPMALMIGIIFRSFFMTRKLGGLLMAFGIGFLLVFPLSYALAMYTVQTTLYGTTTTGGDVANEFCTASCRQLPPNAYKTSGGLETYQRSDITGLFPPEGCASGYVCIDGECAHSQAADPTLCDADEEYIPGYCIDPGQSCENNDAYKKRIDDLMKGRECTIIAVPDGEGGFTEFEACNDLESEVSPVTSKTIYFCGYYDEVCPAMCRTLPYSNSNPECASRYTEYQCREIVPKECFITRFASLDDPILSGMEPIDKDACPLKCRPLVGLQKEGCRGMTGYGFVITGEDKVEDIDDQMDDDGYNGDSFQDRCRDEIKNKHCNDDDNATRALERMDFEDVKDGGTIAWDEGCPNNCRWVTETGALGPGCQSSVCGKIPATPNTLRDTAMLAAVPDDYDLQIQMDQAEQTCYTVIPSDVFTDPDCVQCTYLMDPGFASLPPVHQRCDSLCGKAKKVAATPDSDSMETGIDGFSGPLEMKSITKLVAPAIILPMLNLVITFIFIRTLSPILGGDIDIPGMMGTIR